MIVSKGLFTFDFFMGWKHNEVLFIQLLNFRITNLSTELKITYLIDRGINDIGKSKRRPKELLFAYKSWIVNSQLLFWFSPQSNLYQTTKK